MPKNPPPNYRRDIDAIRGLAVLLVVAFHAAPAWVRGGFIGVDVFFVISGYLISSILFTDLLGQRFSIRRFYARRIKRIFPSLTVVLASVLMVGWFFLWPSEYKTLGKHAFGGASFVANFLLWRESGYFAAKAEFRPLLHLWSLGVEEQFYLLFPVGLWWIHRLWPHRTPNTFAALGAFGALSFALCVYGTSRFPSAAFYFPLTRFWELVAGSLGACLRTEHRRRLCSASLCAAWNAVWEGKSSSLIRILSSMVGLALVLGASLVLTDKAPFPGVWALLPTVGTVLLLAAGEDHAGSNRPLLGSDVLIGVGLISYPLYLWHWPLLFFVRVLNHGALPAVAAAGAVAGAFALAALTYRYVEAPIRFTGVLGRRTVVFLASAMTIVAVAGILIRAGVLQTRLARSPLSKQVEEAVQDWDYPFPENYDSYRAFHVDARLEAPQGGPAVLLIGDSHMQQYWPRIKYVLDHNPRRARPLMLITAGGSPSLPYVRRFSPGIASDELFESALTEAAKTNIGTVVFSCSWETYFLGDYPDGEPAKIYDVRDPARHPLRVGDARLDEILAEFGRRIQGLVGSGKQVYVLMGTPSCTQWDPNRISRVHVEMGDIDRLGVLRKDIEARVQPLEKKIFHVVTSNGGKVINPRERMGEGEILYGRTISGKFYFRDGGHLRPFYAIEVATFLDSLIERPKEAPSFPAEDTPSLGSPRD